jgi:hypothetical protein
LATTDASNRLLHCSRLIALFGRFDFQKCRWGYELLGLRTTLPYLSERFNLFPMRVRPRVVHRLAAGCDVFPASVVVSEETALSVVCEPLASLNRRIPLSHETSGFWRKRGVRLYIFCWFPLLIASRRWLQLGFSKLSQGDSTLFCLTDGCIS